MPTIHPGARTTPAVRAEIARSTEPSCVLAHVLWRLDRGPATLCELNACAGRSGQHVHLHMNSTFLDRERRFFYRLGQRRMGVASAGDVLG